jgi:diacylglycerol O-acyltransferase / wax synthase
MAHWDRLSALDASFLDIETDASHMHVGVALLFDARPLQRPDGGLDFDRIRDFIDARLLLIPRYRQRLAWTPFERHPVWIDDARFNLHYHVRHTALPPPGDERLLKRLCGRLVSQQLDRGKPLWEIWVVEGLEGERFALVAKVHHCMVDGVSGMDVLAALLAPAPQRAVEPAPRWAARTAPTPGELLIGEAVRRVATPFRLAQAACRTLGQPRQALAAARDTIAGVVETLGGAAMPASPTPLNGAIGPHRRFDWLRFDLDAVRGVKARLGGTINDVVLAVVAGAVRRFLARRGAAVDGLDFRALVPVSVRASTEHGTLGNRVAQLIAPLPVGERDAARRLGHVRATIDALKHSHRVLGSEALEDLGDWTATQVLSEIMRLAVQRRAYNIVVTNVPGPQVPLFLLEAPLLSSYPMLPLFANQTLGVALFSYADGLYWGVNSDWDAVPDLHDFVEALSVEFETLRRADTASAA